MSRSIISFALLPLLLSNSCIGANIIISEMQSIEELAARYPDRRPIFMEVRVGLHRLGVQIAEIPPYMGVINLQVVSPVANLEAVVPLLQRIYWMHSLNIEAPASVDFQWVGNFPNLNSLGVGNSEAPVFPDLSKLEELSELTLKSTSLTVVPPSIFNVTRLSSLAIVGTQITRIPKGIEKLVNLQQLNIYGNEISKLSKRLQSCRLLTDLNISANPIENLPVWIGSLSKLRRFEIRDTLITAFHFSLMNLNPSTIVVVDDDIVARGSEPDELGKLELKNYFEKNVQFVSPGIVKYIYKRLDSRKERVNRDWLKNAKVQELPTDILDGEEVADRFDYIIDTLNLNDAKQPGYLSCAIFKDELEHNADPELIARISAILSADDPDGSENEDIIRSIVQPRVTNFLNALFDVPLPPETDIGWQIKPELKIPEQRAISFALNHIVSIDNIDEEAIATAQLICALLTCPTGQAEGLNTIVYNFLGYGEHSATDLVSLVTAIVAKEKNEAFKSALVERIPHEPQGVHLVSYCRDILKDEIGLPESIDGYEEGGLFGHLGRRLGCLAFQGFEEPRIYAGALSTFYRFVTPDRIIDWVHSKVQTKDDWIANQLCEDVEELQALHDRNPDAFIAVPEGLVHIFQANNIPLDEVLYENSEEPRFAEGGLFEASNILKQIRDKSKVLRPIDPSDVASHLITMGPDSAADISEFFDGDIYEIGAEPATVNKRGIRQLLIYMKAILLKE
ncbi:MAG: leucine-rich repeat domain-containing protein [Holosporales bacterium]|jgi:hypothetical protein|nr:leucine-rich repeat domain-containing protein [Holosporales bacterium]